LLALKAVRKITHYIICIVLLASCQRELHFPSTPVVIVPPEKLVAAVVITNPSQSDYDSMVFRYGSNIIREVHYNLYTKDSVTRTYFYDAAGRLSKLEDEKAIYYTNNDTAKRITFQYDANGHLVDFSSVKGVAAKIVTNNPAGNKQVIVYDTAYRTASYNLDWANRVIYTAVDGSNYILYDSAVFLNTSTAGLVKTIVADYQYASDSSVTSINKRIYFNQQLSEAGTVSATSDRVAPVYKSFRKKLYRNLSNWFESGSAWQDDNYRLFPLPGGPYKSILYQGLSFSADPVGLPFTRNYDFDNTYSGDQLNKSIVTYSLSGQGNNHYVNILRFYYIQ
jgi:hypothetical protein